VTTVVRAEEAADRAAVEAVHRAAFPSAAEARLVNMLRTSGRAAVSLVAETDDQVVGHILFSPVSVEPARPGVAGAGLAPVAVPPSRQCQGIGSQLVMQGIAACRRAGFDFIVVLGDPAYYRRFGFAPASGFGLGNEYGADREFMVLELSTGCLRGMHGTVRYSDEFSSLAA